MKPRETPGPHTFQYKAPDGKIYKAAVDSLKPGQSKMRCINEDYTNKQKQDFKFAFTDPHMEPMVEQSMNSKLWFIPVRINCRKARPHYALVDTGCSMTCIRESTWLSMKRHRNEKFEKHKGVITGAAGDTEATIEGTATIRLYLMDDQNNVLELTTRAMIVRDLQGPLFLGQDIFENSKVYSFINSKEICFRSQAGEHHVPFTTGGEENLVSMCCTLIPKVDLTMKTVARTRVAPLTRMQVEVQLEKEWPFGTEIEMVPLSDIEQDLQVVPCVNYVHAHRSSVMVENRTDQAIWVPQGRPLCMIAGNSLDDNYDETLRIEAASDEEIAAQNHAQDPSDRLKENLTRNFLNATINKTVEDSPDTGEQQPLDDERTFSEKIKEINSAIIDEMSIPEEFDILKKPRTLSDEQLIAKFDLAHLSKKSREKVIHLILRFREIWSEHSFDLGLHRYVQHNIVLTDPLPPCPKQRFWAASKREAAEELIDNLEKYKIVEKCISDWATNVVLIKKQADPANAAMEQTLLDSLLDKNTIPTPPKAKYRLCLDLRPTNSVTKADVATLGNMDSMFMHLSGKPARSSFDFTNGFFQIGLTKESQGTTFFVHRKSGSCIMKFNRSIQGSKNASSVFTRAMEVTFTGLQNIVNYWVDDLITYSEDEDKHIKDLEVVFERIRDSNMKLSPEKAKFLAGTVKYLGMVIEGDKFCIADKKLKAIDDLLPPKNYVQLRSQLALFQYYKKFVPFFSEVVRPLQRMMRKGVEFVWDEECTAAYVLLKSLFKEKISLHLPNPAYKYIIHTDASSFASSAVLHQRVNGELVPVAFHSEAFTGPQIAYSILDKELYAMVDSIKRFEYYLAGTEFEVFTDSKALLYLRKAKDSNPKLLRYSLALQGYDFTITHISSSENKIADILSRTTNEEGQIMARRLHMAKKAMLEKIRQDTVKIFIQEGKSLSSDQVVKLLQEPYVEGADLSFPSWKPEDMQKVILFNMENRGPDQMKSLQRVGDSIHDKLFRKEGVPVREVADRVKLSIFQSRPIFISAEQKRDRDFHERERQEQIIAATSFQSGGMHIEDFKKLQEEDEYCQEIVSAMKHKGMGLIYGKIAGVIVKFPPKVESKSGSKKKLSPDHPRPVVPEKLVPVLINRIHAGPTSAHVGPSKVYSTLKKKYHFQDMQGKIRTQIASCVPCQLTMYSTRGLHELHMTTHDEVPRRSVAIDLATDYPRVQGWNHIMVFVDLASNYVSLKPLRTKTSKELAENLKEYMASYGIPEVIRHDQEKGLTGGDVKELCLAHGITQVTGLPNKPQTNGKVEAQVKNIKYALKSLTTALHTKGKWPAELWKVQIALNTAVTRATTETPELVMFGHESRKNCYDLISRYVRGADVHHGTERININKRAEFISGERHSHHRLVLEHRNKDRRINTYRQGDLVWRHIMQPMLVGTRHALDCRYTGPFRIVQLGESSAVIASDSVKLTNQATVHLDQLKPFVAGSPELDPEWDNLLNHSLNVRDKKSDGGLPDDSSNPGDDGGDDGDSDRGGGRDGFSWPTDDNSFSGEAEGAEDRSPHPSNAKVLPGEDQRGEKGAEETAVAPDSVLPDPEEAEVAMFVPETLPPDPGKC